MTTDVKDIAVTTQSGTVITTKDGKLIGEVGELWGNAYLAMEKALDASILETDADGKHVTYLADWLVNLARDIVRSEGTGCEHCEVKE